jgi:hypothetical protein
MPRKAVGQKRTNKADVPASRLVEKPATRTGRVPLTEVEDIVRRMLETQLRSPWFDTEEAARYLRKEASTLKVWRSKGHGPHFHVVNRQYIRYHVDDLDAFVRGGTKNLSAENPPRDKSMT